MYQSELTVRDAMSFTRHDFLNELQLILMHMDLDNNVEARRQLLDVTERMRIESQVSALRMPVLETWILSFNWHHSEFTKQLKTHVVASQSKRRADEDAVVASLDELLNQLAAGADPYSDNAIELTVEATPEQWSVSISLPGQTAPIAWNERNETDWIAELSIENEYWTFTYRGQ